MSLPSPVLRVEDLATSRESTAHFGLPWVRSWENRGKCYMDGKRIQCSSNASQHVYPSIFNRLRTIARYWSEIAAFSYPLAFNAPIGVLPLEFRGKVWSS